MMFTRSSLRFSLFLFVTCRIDFFVFIDPPWNFKRIWADHCQAREHLCCPPRLIPTFVPRRANQSEHLGSPSRKQTSYQKDRRSIGYAKMRSLAKIQKKIYIYLHFIGYWASYLSYFSLFFFPLYPLLPTWNFWWVWEGRMCLPLKTKYFVSSCTSSHLLYNACLSGFY